MSDDWTNLHSLNLKQTSIELRREQFYKRCQSQREWARRESFYKKTRPDGPAKDLLKIAKDSGASVTKISNEDIKKTHRFYQTKEWKKFRLVFLEGKELVCNICQCDLTAQDAPVLNVDHIKPLKYYWDLRTDLSNLQILCNDCNRHKGNYVGSDVKDYVLRKKEEESLYTIYRATESAKASCRLKECEKVLEENKNKWTKDFERKNRNISLAEYLRQRTQNVVNRNRRGYI
jgi:hypothetical protein